MLKFFFPVVFGVVTLASFSTSGNDDTKAVRSDAHRQWVGSWQASEEFNRLLGFHGDQSRRDAIFDHPSSFRLSLDKNIGANIDPRALAMYRDTIFKRMGHRIVATGKWETTFDVDPGIETDCFITQGSGSIFLWVGAPYVVVFGGKVSHIKGSTQKHDVMVIDFNVDGKHRTPDTVAYKRKSE